jgi:hypothetical protein
MFNRRRHHLQALIVAVLMIGVVVYEAGKWVWRIMGWA